LASNRWSAASLRRDRSKLAACHGSIHQKGRKGLDPDFSRSSHYEEAAETRMGKGKGPVEGYGASSSRGVYFYIGRHGRRDGEASLEASADKLPVKTQFLTRERFK
jgi:ribosomal protein L16/L10AE